VVAATIATTRADRKINRPGFDLRQGDAPVDVPEQAQPKEDAMTQTDTTPLPLPQPAETDALFPVELALNALLAEMHALAGLIPGASGAPVAGEDEVEAQFDNMPV
jgi:hypothetical protein